MNYAIYAILLTPSSLSLYLGSIRLFPSFVLQCCNDDVVEAVRITSG